VSVERRGELKRRGEELKRTCGRGREMHDERMQCDEPDER